MNTKPLIVLKFGGSVLLSESSLRRAVHEIYRWRRDGWKVIAVVSSLCGRTDELLACCDRFGSAVDSSARAAFLATGEFESAALLNLQLERSGVPSVVITPGAAGLVAAGDAVDASPLTLEGPQLPAALAREDVVVFPGYVACTRLGQPVVLGRGGSDLTALFLAAELGAARCRLIKDVDGLYESDPAGKVPRPLRFACADYADALRTDGSIIQHKAVRFAAKRGLDFELGSINADLATRIGNLETHLEHAPPATAPLRVGLLGHGTVGGGVAALLADYPQDFILSGVAVRDRTRHSALPEALVWTDPIALAGGEADVLVEALGGVDTPYRAVRAALQRGAHVVSANKALLASRSASLQKLARATNVRVRGSAAVGAAVPVLEALCRPGARRVVGVQGILCGTANFVLQRLDEGESLAAATAAARRRGLAEVDPSRDLDGRDAADKLCVIASVLGGPALDPDRVVREPISAGGLPPGTRQVATLRRVRDGWDASVRLVVPDAASPLFRAWHEQNAVVLERKGGDRELLLGSGAGRWPTAEAVMADLLEIARGPQRLTKALQASRSAVRRVV